MASAPGAAGGLGNVWEKGAELDERRSGAGCKHLVPMEEECARTTGVCLEGSDRSMARIWTVAAGAACSRRASCEELSAGGDDVRIGVSPTRSLLALEPGSGREESRAGEGWSGAGTGSRLGSWSGQLVVGVGDEGAVGTRGALVERRVEVDRGYSSVHMPQSCGICVHPCSTCCCAGYSCTRRDGGHKVHGLMRRGGNTGGCGD